MSNLPHKAGDRWPEHKRVEAAACYAATGSLLKCESLTGIPHETIGHWKRNDPEWLESVTTLQQENQQEARGRFSSILEAAQQRTLDDLDNASAAQAHLIACQAIDKIRMVDGQPDRYSSTSQSVASLAAMFAELSADHKRIARDHDNIQASVVQDNPSEE